MAAALVILVVMVVLGGWVDSKPGAVRLVSAAQAAELAAI